MDLGQSLEAKEIHGPDNIALCYDLQIWNPLTSKNEPLGVYSSTTAAGVLQQAGEYSVPIAAPEAFRVVM